MLNNTHQFDNILVTDNVNNQVKIFNEVFTECLDNVAPFVTKEIKRPFAPWFNEDIRQAIIYKNNTLETLKIIAQIFNFNKNVKIKRKW